MHILDHKEKHSQNEQLEYLYYKRENYFCLWKKVIYVTIYTFEMNWSFLTPFSPDKCCIPVQSTENPIRSKQECLHVAVYNSPSKKKKKKWELEIIAVPIVVSKTNPWCILTNKSKYRIFCQRMSNQSYSEWIGFLGGSSSKPVLTRSRTLTSRESK